MQRPNARIISEEEILATLTARGREPLEHCFVLQKAIKRWDSQCGMAMTYMLDDDLFADACKAYLRARGLAFDTPEEFERHVRDHNWPNLEKLLPLIEFWKRRAAERKAERQNRG